MPLVKNQAEHAIIAAEGMWVLFPRRRAGRSLNHAASIRYRAFPWHFRQNLFRHHKTCIEISRHRQAFHILNRLWPLRASTPTSLSSRSADSCNEVTTTCPGRTPNCLSLPAMAHLRKQLRVSQRCACRLDSDPRIRLQRRKNTKNSIGLFIFSWEVTKQAGLACRALYEQCGEIATEVPQCSLAHDKVIVCRYRL